MKKLPEPRAAFFPKDSNLHSLFSLLQEYNSSSTVDGKNKLLDSGINEKEVVKDSNIPGNCFVDDEIRFTKVLTKYSTEYNNYMFIQNLCVQMLMDKNDLLTYFLYKRSQNICEEDICNELEQYSVSKLDVSRMFRYLDKYKYKND